MTTTLTKRKRTTTNPVDVASELDEAYGANGLKPLQTGREVIDIPLKSIVPHKHNREITDESVADLAASIRELGQLEPATVRPLPKGLYELISGERRFRALKLAGKSTLAAIVINDSATDGLVRLAAANSNRQDLNAIARAQLMARLMKPESEGGSGLSRIDAGKSVGLMSDSGSKNALRFLKLPKSIQDLIVDGKISERAARRLIPFCELEEAMKIISKELVNDDRLRLELSDEDEFPWFIRRAIENTTRPMDKREFRSSELIKNRHTSYPKLFNGDAGLIVRGVNVDNEDWELTTDIKGWEKLQAPLVLLELNGKSQRDFKTSTKDKGSKAAPVVSDAERMKAANKRLDTWTTTTWIPCALRCELATQVEGSERALLLPSLIELDVGDYRKRLEEVLRELKDKVPTTKAGRHAVIPARGGDSAQLVYSLFGRILWPADDKVLPDLDRLCHSMNREVLHLLASRCDVTLIDFWKSALVNGHQRELLNVWLQRHTTDQLTALWSELKIRATMPKTHGHIALALLEQHDAANQLPLPKRLKVKA